MKSLLVATALISSTFVGAVSAAEVSQGTQQQAAATSNAVVMTDSELNQTVAGASTVYRSDGFGYYGYDGRADWKSNVSAYDNLNYKPGNTNGF